MKNLSKRQAKKHRLFEQLLLEPMKSIPMELYFYSQEENQTARTALLEVLAVLKRLYPKAESIRFGKSGASTPWANRYFGSRILSFKNSLAGCCYNNACEQLADMVHFDCACDRAAIFT